ncbi:hypothetical protein FHS10_000789 [Mucilaginibacter dorajii]|nr:hypothetical protein [Mucilaginibacter dorajii]
MPAARAIRYYTGLKRRPISAAITIAGDWGNKNIFSAGLVFGEASDD